MSTRVFVPIVVVLALLVPAAAEEVCYTTSTTDAETIVLELSGSAAGTDTLYLVNDLCQDDPPSPEPYSGTCTLSLWDYQEVNGIPGLQRQDARHSDVENCDGVVDGDVLFLY